MTGEGGVRELGSGPGLLLLNGYAATKEDWDPGFLAHLAAGSTVVCPDHHGAGIDEMAAGALALLDSRGSETIAVAGWSMGGFVAQALAARAPERISHLVLLSTDPGGAAAARASSEVWARLIDRSGTPREQATRLLGLLFPADFAARMDAELGEIVASVRAQLSAEWLTEQEEAMDAWHAESSDERLEAIRAPALVAWGTEDVVIPGANASVLAQALPHAWLAPFAGGGHAFMAQEPERLAALINAFLGRQQTQPQAPGSRA